MTENPHPVAVYIVKGTKEPQKYHEIYEMIDICVDVSTQAYSDSQIITSEPRACFVATVIADNFGLCYVERAK